MDDNIIKFNNHFHSSPTGNPTSFLGLEQSPYSDRDDYLFDVCHKLCEELFPGYEWGDQRNFNFDQLMEFTKELLKKPNLLEIAFKLLTLDDSEKECN